MEGCQFQRTNSIYRTGRHFAMPSLLCRVYLWMDVKEMSLLFTHYKYQLLTTVLFRRDELQVYFFSVSAIPQNNFHLIITYQIIFKRFSVYATHEIQSWVIALQNFDSFSVLYFIVCFYVPQNIFQLHHVCKLSAEEFKKIQH